MTNLRTSFSGGWVIESGRSTAGLMKGGLEVCFRQSNSSTMEDSDVNDQERQ